MQDKINGFLDLVRERNGNEPEFMQAVEEVAETVGMFIYLQPIIGIIYAIATGSDILKLTDIMAVCLVFTGIYLVSLKKEAN
jgi:EamA domain-containing membrane protein RarD